jgi:hypothetical protein
MKRVGMMGMLFVIGVFADLKKDAMDFVSKGWEVDTADVVIADFNSDDTDDIALVYYRIDPERGEASNRMNRVFILLGQEQGFKTLVDQGLPYDEDFGTEVMLSWDDGILYIFQHMGVAHRFNKWGLEWDAERQAFWQRLTASGGILGLGFIASFDAGTGTGYVEKIWDDIDVSAEYSNIYIKKLSSTINLDGRDAEQDWQDARPSWTGWFAWGYENCKGADDTDLEVRGLYDEKYLYLFVDITDDVYVQPFTGDDIVHGDHIELWIDRLTWEESEATGYYSEMWNRKKDLYVTQIGIAQAPDGSTVARRWLPEDSDWQPEIKAGFQKQLKGWTAELEIPWAYVSPKASPDYLVFSLVFSDSDDSQNPRQETLMGTSGVRWAAPFTFGTLMTEKPDRIYWGIYPEED